MSTLNTCQLLSQHWTDLLQTEDLQTLTKEFKKHFTFLLLLHNLLCPHTGIANMLNAQQHVIYRLVQSK